ncbi:hypothetical protein AHAS_Ahas16G0020200 [Arachis hypogaea]
MAESFIFSIAESLAAKLASRAYQEASRLVGVYDDLQELKSSLSYVKAVLLDAEQKQEQNHELREWLKQIKLIFYDAENFLDEVDCETLSKQVVRDYGTPKDKVGRFFSSSNPLVFRYKLGHQIKEIKKRLDRVAADRNKFGLQVIDVDRRAVHRREMTYSHVVESKVVGREHDKEMIMKLLMEPSLDDNGGSKHISVIPIVGIGGLGKTTLARLVYSNKRVTESFPLKMWVNVPDDFNVRSLIIKIINSPSDFASSTDAPAGQQNLRDLEIEQLQHRLRNMLEDQKFLLVLDDVWNEDRVKWVELQDLISVGAQGSKVIVTTRSQSIASMMGTVACSHNLESLSPEDSLRLFVRWAFKEGEEEKYPELIRIGREIVEKCKGVPLALETLVISGVDNEDWFRSEDTNAVLRLKTIFLGEMVTLPHSLQQYASTLQTLVIACFYELEVLPEWLWNLSSLKSLYISECPKLKSLPSDIHRLTSLQVLQIIKCPELYRKYEPQVGECWPMISHIKHTDIRDTWE